jgi:hypothetical protein
MQKRSGQLGEMFVNLGLITEEDVEHALAHQREFGGYFGDALVQLGLVTQDQVRWGLADQYDIPFVQIRPENIDRRTAVTVPASWAREHLILPVLRDGTTVTVILADPASVKRLDEVRRFTRAERVEAALSSATTIRELIDSVHGEGSGPPIAFREWIGDALAAGASQVGISVRGDRVRGWSRGEDNAVRKLEDGWMEELLRVVSPFPEAPRGEARSWPAVVAVNGTCWNAECHAIGHGRTLEWTAQIRAALPRSFPAVQVDDDVRDAIAAASARGSVTIRLIESDAGEADLLDVMAATLPVSVCGGDCRSVHLADRAVAVPPGVFRVAAGESLERTIASLGVFALDVLTVDVNAMSAADLAAARQVAPLVVVRIRSATPDDFAADLNICLRARGDELFWTFAGRSDATD